MDKIKKYILSICGVFLAAVVFAQNMDKSTEDPTDFMRSDGKIYVVVAVLVIIMIGLFLYLFNLDRKIKKLEKNQ